MPARNIYHDAVVKTLLAEGWEITHNPLTLSYGGKDLFVDIAAERATIAAEKNGDEIWIQYDGTIRPVAEELLAAGIPREAIVLGFHPTEIRHHTEFAVG